MFISNMRTIRFQIKPELVLIYMGLGGAIVYNTHNEREKFCNSRFNLRVIQAHFKDYFFGNLQFTTSDID